jgi:hypothetical protein
VVEGDGDPISPIESEGRVAPVVALRATRLRKWVGLEWKARVLPGVVPQGGALGVAAVEPVGPGVPEQRQKTQTVTAQALRVALVVCRSDLRLLVLALNMRREGLVEELARS